MEDDIEKQKSELEEVKKDIRIYTEEKEELSQKKYLYEIRESSQRWWNGEKNNRPIYQS